MLAPHLYYVLVDLLRLWDKPVKIFEVGPCFRKESHGARHSSEFTMLNLVEMGLPADQRKDRIKELGALVAEAAGISEYISGPLCQNYMDYAQLESADLSLLLHEYHHPEYRQLYPPFTPFLSVIDLLFNEGVNSLAILNDPAALGKHRTAN